MKGAYNLIQTQSIALEQTGSFIHDYRNQTKKAMEFFEYEPFESLTKRYHYLKTQTFPRKKLVDAIQQMHQKWDAPEHTYTHIQKLADENSSVVIGGQQAGVLTGPLYSINKLISIIQYARKQEMLLQAPVLPVFWIAGEDHDFEEVNHVFIQEKNRLRKHRIRQHVQEKATVSSTFISHDVVGQWVDAVFASLEETVHAPQVYQMVHDCLGAAETYVDFFARMLFALFPNEPFLLVDSADSTIRQIEQPYFERLIEHQQQIATSIYRTDVAFNRAQYNSIVDVSPNDGHLFYHLDGERILLERDTRNNWVGKQKEVVFSNDELLDVAKNEPELLSNNVMTRPLMQEMLFPTLAFVGGGGEITYWALLKEAFTVTRLQMPPVIPRLSFTYIDHRTASTLQTLQVDLEEMIQQGAHPAKMYFLSKQTTVPVEEVMSAVRERIHQVYEPLHLFTKEIRDDMEELSKANEEIVLKELHYLQKRMERAVREPVENTLKQFAEVDQMLHPNDGLQERVWNPVPFLVGQGLDIFERVLQEPFDFEQTHYAIFI